MADVFSPLITVHSNRDEITHRFESMIVDTSGRIFIAWIDKRDAEAARAKKEKYAGAAIYYKRFYRSGSQLPKRITNWPNIVANAAASP